MKRAMKQKKKAGSGSEVAPIAGPGKISAVITEEPRMKEIPKAKEAPMRSLHEAPADCASVRDAKKPNGAGKRKRIRGPANEERRLKHAQKVREREAAGE